MVAISHMINGKKTISKIESAAKDLNRKTLLIDCSRYSTNGSFLVCKLCKQTMMPIIVFIDLNNNLLDDAIKENIKPKSTHYIDLHSNIYNAGYHNGLVYSAALTNNSLIVSPRSKNDTIFSRRYDKFEPADIFPIIEFSVSEIMGINKNHGFEYNELDSKILSNEMSDIDVTEKELEWLEVQNDIYGIITSDSDPTSNGIWFKFTPRQKQIISKVHQLEKITRHKQ